MNDSVFIQYANEAENWLKRGRLYLIDSLITKNISNQSNLEILEIGPGVGQNINHLHQFGIVDVVEPHPLGLESLKNNSQIRNIFPQKVPFCLDKGYDLICALDVLEHIENDIEIINWVNNHLKPGGYFLVVVPAHQWLYSSHDIALGHVRRYNLSHLESKLVKDFKIIQSGYFNSFLFPLAVIIRLAKKLQIFHNSTNKFKKDSSLVPNFLNTILKRILFWESKLIKKNCKFPYGLSTFCLVKLD